MAKKRTTKKSTIKSTKKIHKNRRRNFLRRRLVLLVVLAVTFLVTGFYLKEKVAFYYAMYFDKFEHKKLKNNEREAARIDRIIGAYADKTFGIDISHYQNPKDIRWDSLSIGNRTIPLKFIVLRATMGNTSKDKNFEEFWRTAKKHNLIRGAYHFYRPDEDPVKQANNFLETVKLEEGDLLPILDIEKLPLKYTQKELNKNLKIWLKIVEEKYDKKPVIYTFYHYYKDNLRSDFDEYPLWLANYNNVPQPSADDDWKIWQFTENGIVYGINTKVDLNVFNGNIWSLKKLTVE